MFRTLCALALSTLAAVAQAHQIWLEQPGQANKGTAVIRFGEFGQNLRETSPGALDSFVALTATHISAQGEKSVQGSKTASGFVLPFALQAGESIVAQDTNFPLQQFTRDGKQLTSWYWPAARLVADFSPQQPKLVLDLVPTGKVGEFKLFFKGQPLAKTTVKLVTQSGWAKAAQTDEQGTVRFDLPWKGQYVAESSHVDRTPGERAGAKYDGVSYVTTLTYVQPQGVEPITAAPAVASDQ